ncbi:MAG TPA: hypothetical protein VGL02_26345 [Streptomyces sp.]
MIWPTYQLGDLWAANVDDDYGCRWIVLSQTYNSGPPRRTHITDKPFGMGSYRADSDVAARYDTIAGWCDARAAGDGAGGMVAAEAAMDRLKRLASERGVLPLTKSTPAGDRVLQVELNTEAIRAEMWESADGFEWQLQTASVDPRWLSPTLLTAGPVSAGAASTDGLDWASGSPGGLDWTPGSPGGLDWGISGVGGVLTLTNPGTAPTWPVYTVTGPWLNPSFTDPTTGDVVAYNGLVDLGQTLVIDSSPFTRSVQLNGVDRIGLLSAVQWIEVPPGGQVTVQCGGSGTGTVFAAWPKADN